MIGATVMAERSEQLIDLILPSSCVGCGKGGGRVLCAGCLGRLASRCDSSDSHRPSIDFPFKPHFRLYRAPGQYRGLIKEMVLRLKGGAKPFAIPLGRLMIVAAGNDPEFLTSDVIYSVPSTRVKIKQRGYNPAEALASVVSRQLGRPLACGLEKIRRTEDQDRLPGKRRMENVHGAFKVISDQRPRGPVLLVDDVFTTGATADACAAALLEAGATSVNVLAAARAVLCRF